MRGIGAMLRHLLLVLAFVPVLVSTAGGAGPESLIAGSKTSGQLDDRLSDSTTSISGSVRLDAGRFTIVAGHRDRQLAASLLAEAQRNDSFPALPRPRAHVLIAIAPDYRAFRSWVGPMAPEWGAAIAIPGQSRIVMQGRSAGAEAGNPVQVLRHELAHLALHESVGRTPSRWFDEGYAGMAAGEFSREEMLGTSVGLIWRTMPGVAVLDEAFQGDGAEAAWGYAMAQSAVVALRDMGGDQAFAKFLEHWKRGGSFERALRETYGMTSEQFDAYWHRQTRRRYGALSVAANFTAFAAMVAVLIVPAYLGKRRRNRERLEEMRARDAAEEALLAETAANAAAQSAGEDEEDLQRGCDSGYSQG